MTIFVISIHFQGQIFQFIPSIPAFSYHTACQIHNLWKQFEFQINFLNKKRHTFQILTKKPKHHPSIKTKTSWISEKKLFQTIKSFIALCNTQNKKLDINLHLIYIKICLQCDWNNIFFIVRWFIILISWFFFGFVGCSRKRRVEIDKNNCGGGWGWK